MPADAWPVQRRTSRSLNYSCLLNVIGKRMQDDQRYAAKGVALGAAEPRFHASRVMEFAQGRGGMVWSTANGDVWARP
jgi:hypothetical protein